MQLFKTMSIIKFIMQFHYNLLTFVPYFVYQASVWFIIAQIKYLNFEMRSKETRIFKLFLVGVLEKCRFKSFNYMTIYANVSKFP